MASKSKRINEEKFRIQNRYLMLTYNGGHHDKPDLILFITNKLASLKSEVNFIRCAHEVGSKTARKHTHVLIECSPPLKTQNCRLLDYKNDHPNWKTHANKYHFLHCKTVYITKEDKENEDLIVKKNSESEDYVDICGMVQKAPNLSEAINSHFMTSGFAGISGIEKIYALKSRPLKRFNYVPSRPWELELMEMVSGEPNYREIIWIYDFLGNQGKSALSKYMTVQDPESWLMFKDMGTARDAATILQEEIKKGWNSHGMTINLPRTAENHTRMYEYIENIKDGAVTAQKYVGGSIIFDSPHIVIFSNWIPTVTNLSADRWRIYEILDSKLVPRSYEYCYNQSHSNTNATPVTENFGLVPTRPRH